MHVNNCMNTGNGTNLQFSTILIFHGVDGNLDQHLSFGKVFINNYQKQGVISTYVGMYVNICNYKFPHNKNMCGAKHVFFKYVYGQNKLKFIKMQFKSRKYL